MIHSYAIQTPSTMFRKFLQHCLNIIFIITIVGIPALAQTNVLPPAAQDAINKGIIAAKIPDYLLAIRYFEEARKIAPLSSEVFFNIGLAESKLPGRELRAICWFGAYLTGNPDASNKAAVKEQIDMLDVISQSNIYRFLKTMQDAAGQTSGDKQSENLNKVAELLAKANDIAGAQKTTDLIQNVSWKSSALKAIAQTQANAGDIAGALKIADLLHDSGPNQNWKSYALLSIAQAQANAGDIAGAQKIADLLHDSGPNQNLKSSALLSIAKAQAKASDISEAQKTVDLLQDSGPKEDWKSSALLSIAQAQAKAVDISGAQKTANLLQDLGPNHTWKSYAQRAIVEAQAKSGDSTGAQKTFASALMTADLIQDTIVKRFAQTAIAVAQAKSGDSTGAQKTFASALMTADLIQDTSGRRLAQTAIAEAQIKCGDIKSAQKTLLIALATADLYKDTYRKSVGYARIAILRSKTGDIMGAQKIIDLIEDAGWKSYAKAGIVQGNQVLDAPVHTTVADWLGILDDDYKSNAYPLNTEPFLDLSNYLKSINASDPQKFFEGLQGVADKIVSAQNAIKKMMKKIK